MLLQSASNPKIKELLKLRFKAQERKAKGLFTVEGLKEISMALDAGFNLESVFHYPELGATPPKVEQKKYFSISPDIFKKLAYREDSDGLIAVFQSRRHALDDLTLSANPLLIILEKVEKPGNLGAILRTADAAGADAVIVCDPKTDIYNPNVIRSSVGCLFSVQSAACSSDECLEWLQKNRIKPYAAALTGKKSYTQADLSAPLAIVLGTEADGLSDKWLENCEQIRIPMHGKNDSLNVSASAAIIVFEALRQRSKA